MLTIADTVHVELRNDDGTEPYFSEFPLAMDALRKFYADPAPLELLLDVIEEFFEVHEMDYTNVPNFPRDILFVLFATALDMNA